MSIGLRIATINDIDMLHHWDQLQHVIDSDPNDDWNWEEELANEPVWREQLMADLDGRPIGFVQIIDPAEEDSHYWGEVEPNLRAIDIWIGAKEDLGKGYGTVMMGLAIDRCFDKAEVTAILIDPLESNEGAIKFYQKMGFEFVEKRRFGEDNCHVYRLTREAWMKKT